MPKFSLIDTITCGEALATLKTMPDRSANIVYLDPPFFSNKTHRLVSRVTGAEYQFEDKFDSLDDYLALMVPVLQESKRILVDDGSVFLHCDRHASHHLRIALDEVFGETNFQSEIIWTYKRWSNSKTGLLNAHQNIYFYSKGDTFKFNLIRTDYSPTTNLDQILQERARNESGKSCYKRDQTGRIVFARTKLGVPLTDVWDIPYLNPKAKERCGYPTQKPVKLLQRIIELTTEKGDLVVDPFCGSGSTCVAAKSLARHFYGIEINGDAVLLANKRLKEMVISESRVLSDGLDSFKEKTSLENSILLSLGAIPVQRNKGIDGFINCRNQMIPVKIQKETETLEDALTFLETATRGKATSIRLLIQTNNRHDPVRLDMPKQNVHIIPSLCFQISTFLDQAL